MTAFSSASWMSGIYRITFHLLESTHTSRWHGANSFGLLRSIPREHHGWWRAELKIHFLTKLCFFTKFPTIIFIASCDVTKVSLNRVIQLILRGDISKWITGIDDVKDCGTLRTRYFDTLKMGWSGKIGDLMVTFRFERKFAVCDQAITINPYLEAIGFLVDHGQIT